MTKKYEKKKKIHMCQKQFFDEYTKSEINYFIDKIFLKTAFRVNLTRFMHSRVLKGIYFPLVMSYLTYAEDTLNEQLKQQD